MNKLNYFLSDDPREKALRDAVYRAVARRGAEVRDDEMRAAPQHVEATT